MTDQAEDYRITTREQLAEHFGTPKETSLVKESDVITPHYRAFIEASPFAILATANDAGIDVSPRGDAPGFVTVENERTLLLPDRLGNNRFDSLTNILDDPRVALIFLVPGTGLTIRVRGRAEITIRPDLLQRFVVKGKPPRSVIVIAVEKVYFQCKKAIVRSGLWEPEKWPDISGLPTAGTILQDMSNASIDGEQYDADYPARMAKTLY